MCPAGAYCSGGETAPSGVCAPGHFCPASTPRRDSHACGAGTFSADEGLAAGTECEVRAWLAVEGKGRYSLFFLLLFLFLFF